MMVILPMSGESMKQLHQLTLTEHGAPASSTDLAALGENDGHMTYPLLPISLAKFSQYVLE